MVTLELFEHLKKILKSDGVLIYSGSNTASLSAMVDAGFCLTAAGRPKSDIHGIIAKHTGPSLEYHAIVPYRDPYGVWTDRKIRQHREQEIKKQKC
jgi:hypothetical protein